MTLASAHPATVDRNVLGEGILWDDRTRSLVWVDIDRGTIYRGTLSKDHTVRTTQTLKVEGTVGAVALTEDGGMLVAGTRQLITVSPDGQVTYGPDLLGERSNVRWNDGSADPQGRFLVGSLALDGSIEQERLIRVTHDGGVEVLREGITLSNGIGFSPDGNTVYHVDSIPGTVSSHSYGPGEFDEYEPWKVVIDSFDGTPDGLTVDDSGNLWIAEWGEGKVTKYSPDGDPLGHVTVNAPLTTSAAFVGGSLELLAVTTASKGIQEPTDGSGRLFIAQPAEARGQRTLRWAGSTREPIWLESVQDL